MNKPVIMSTIEALEGAIEMLSAIRRGKRYSFIEYHGRLADYQAARDQHRHNEREVARGRAKIRHVSQRLRVARRAS